AGMIPGLGLSTGWGAGLGAALGLLSDRRAKENIRRVGETDSGLPVYVYNYKGDPVEHMGVMADEAEEKFPEAVYEGADGYKRVICGRLQCSEQGLSLQVSWAFSQWKSRADCSMV